MDCAEVCGDFAADEGTYSSDASCWDLVGWTEAVDSVGDLGCEG